MCLSVIKLRPHHILDIITKYGNHVAIKPHPYGHDVHRIAELILSEPETQVKLIVGADVVCRPCRFLSGTQKCTDVLRQCEPPVTKQTYNDSLDRKVLTHFNLREGTVITIRAYLNVVGMHVPGLEKICTHPGEDPDRRLKGLTEGLRMFGILCQ